MEEEDRDSTRGTRRMTGKTLRGVMPTPPPRDSQNDPLPSQAGYLHITFKTAWRFSSRTAFPSDSVPLPRLPPSEGFGQYAKTLQPNCQCLKADPILPC